MIRDGARVECCYLKDAAEWDVAILSGAARVG